jgi:hypothetical protein
MSRAARDPLLRAKELALQGLNDVERELVRTAIRTAMEALLHVAAGNSDGLGVTVKQREDSVSAYLTLKHFSSNFDPHDQRPR